MMQNIFKGVQLDGLESQNCSSDQIKSWRTILLFILLLYSFIYIDLPQISVQRDASC